MATIQYSVNFNRANEHYASVSLIVRTNHLEHTDFLMPVWTPGSYKLREFSQHINFFKARSENDNPLRFEKINKSTWRVFHEPNTEIQIEYAVYCFEISVRQSYVDQFYAYLLGTSVFMLPLGHENEETRVTFKTPVEWKNIEMPLNQKGNNTFEANNYDELVDAPAALGNFEIINYTSFEVPHKVVMIGKGNYNSEQIAQDFKLISDEATKIFGEIPCNQYIHFIQNVDNGGGGLEHANSQTSQMIRNNYTNKDKYLDFLGLIAHEYFHLWNVKRLRPIELGPFDYSQENYSKLLWMAEGFTSYYDELILLKAGLQDKERYLKQLSINFNKHYIKDGKHHMNLEEASFDAWVKAYLPNENSNNTTISYYTKGSIAACILDMILIKTSNEQKSLDDLMQFLYKKYYLEQDRGFTTEEFEKDVRAFCSEDISWFFDKIVRGCDSEAAISYFEDFGLKVNNLSEQKLNWGFSLSKKNNHIYISSVESQSAATKAGLSANDEILYVESQRITELSQINDWFTDTNKSFTLGFSRDGIVYETSIKPTYAKTNEFEIPKENNSNKTLIQWWLRDIK